MSALLIIVGILITGVSCDIGYRSCVVPRVDEPLEMAGRTWQPRVDMRSIVRLLSFDRCNYGLRVHK